MTSLNISLSEVPETVRVPPKYLSGGSIGAQIAYGKIATRQPGYHSQPHLHGAEQHKIPGLGDRLEFQGDSIHAVALPSGLGPVVEHVAEVTAAVPAMHFRSWNDQAVIVRGADGILNRRKKARPAGAAVEFGFGAKERQIAGSTSEQTRAMLVIERAGMWPLRPALPQHPELLGGQYLLPFCLRL